MIADFGEMSSINDLKIRSRNTIDVPGQFFLPAWCDSHTHIVFAASREEEFVDKIKGLSYAEIAAKGGGILNSAKKLNEASEDSLFNSASETAGRSQPAWHRGHRNKKRLWTDC